MEKVWFLNGSYDWVCGEVLGLYGTEASCRKHFEDILSDWWPEGENDTDSRGRTRKVHQGHGLRGLVGERVP